MRGSRGGWGGGPDFAKLNIADITGNKKIVIFHICALPQLYVKQNQLIHIITSKYIELTETVKNLRP